MKQGWEIKRLDDACEVEYGTRVVQKRDGGTVYPVYGGGGATFFMDTFNREDCLVVARFAMSAQCTRFVEGKFFLNDSGLTVRPKNDKELSPDFLDLQMRFLNDHIYSLSRGTAQRNLDVPAFRNIQIVFPKSIQEQQRIVSILDEAFAAIAKAKANAEQNLQNAKELFESYLQGVFEKKGDGWEKQKLSDIAFVKSGGTPSRSKKEYWEGNIAWYSSGELNDIYTKNPERFINELAIENSNAKLFPKGSLLIGMYDTAALKMSIIDRDATFNQAIAGVKPNSKIDLLFIFCAINAQKPELLNLRRGTRQKNLSLEKIKDIQIPLPPIKEQQAIVHQLDALRAETQKLEAIYQQKLLHLEELKKSVLQKAFAGELTSSATLNVSSNKTIPLQKVEGISSTDLQAGITAIALQKHSEQNKQDAFGHVKAEKIVHLAEYILGVDLERNPVKDAAGPNDFPHAKKVESRAAKAGFYTVAKKAADQEAGYIFTQGRSMNSLIQKTQNCLGERNELLSQLLKLLVPMKTQQAEIVATVYAAWNNLILHGNQFTDNDIVTEARENWRVEKLQISREKFFNAIEWMRKYEFLIPIGNGKPVKTKSL